MMNDDSEAVDVQKECIFFSFFSFSFYHVCMWWIKLSIENFASTFGVKRLERCGGQQVAKTFYDIISHFHGNNDCVGKMDGRTELP